MPQPPSARGPAALPTSREAPRQVLPLARLRTALVLLVVAHHAVLAYHPQAPAPLPSLADQPRWWQAFPVLDAGRSELVALFAGWNDMFLMAALFLVSGLFVAASLTRRGAACFLARRLRRLGLPFLAMAALLVPIAYYPAYLATSDPSGIAGFAAVWRALGDWPAGPAWFLWMLLLFDAAAAGLFALRPGFAATAARSLAAVSARPAAAFLLLVAASALVYLPLSILFGPQHWTAAGPFAFQTSRVLLYALYFFAGVAVGAGGLATGLLAPDGPLVRRRVIWGTVAPTAFALTVVAWLFTLAEGAGAAPRLLAGLGFVTTCAATVFALLAYFLRAGGASRPWEDSLRANSYGMYVVHYPFASWLPLALLGLALPGLVKAALSALATIALSWALSAALRRLPAIRRTL